MQTQKQTVGVPSSKLHCAAGKRRKQQGFSTQQNGAGSTLDTSKPSAYFCRTLRDTFGRKCKRRPGTTRRIHASFQKRPTRRKKRRGRGTLCAKRAQKLRKPFTTLRGRRTQLAPDTLSAGTCAFGTLVQTTEQRRSNFSAKLGTGVGETGRKSGR